MPEREDITSSWFERIQLLPASVLALLAAVLAATLLTLLLSELTVDRAKDDNQNVSVVLERLEAAATLRVLILEAEAGHRGYAISGERTYLDRFNEAFNALGPAMSRLEELTDPPQLRNRIDTINRLVTQRLGLASATVDAARAGQTEVVMSMIRSEEVRTLSKQIRDELDAFERESADELDALRASQDSALNASRFGLWLSTFVVFALLLTVLSLFMREAARQTALKEAAESEAQRMQTLVAARTAQLSSLSAHLQEISEREKAELARDLHDEMGGLLTAAKMDLAWLQGAAKQSDPEVGRKLEQLSTILADAMDVKRRVVESLRPALLDHFGLPTALQNYFEETCRKAGIECVTDVGDVGELSRDLSIALFRAAQESLTNIVRHARASRVEVSLQNTGKQILLSIADDGQGFDLEDRDVAGHHGISGMQQRVVGLGGKFGLMSAPGKGTRIDIVVPRNRPSSASL